MPASIRAHLTLLVVALAIPLAGLISYNIYRDTRDAVSQSKASLRTVAVIIATNTERRISDARNTLQWLARRHPAQAPDARHCDGAMRDLRSLYSGFSNIFYTDMQGHIVCSALPLLKEQGQNWQSSDWFQTLLRKRQFTISKPAAGVIPGRNVSVLSMPLLNGGQMVGAVHLPLDLQDYDPGVPTELLPPNSRYGLFEGSGIMIWRNSDPEKVIGQRPNAPAARQIVAVRNGEFEALAVDGVTRFFSVRAVAGTDWVVFAGMPVDAIYTKAYERAQVEIAGSVLGLGALLWLALYLARRIAQPIAALAQAARAIAQGDDSIRVQANGSSELAQVAQEFNAMLEARQRITAELGRHRNQLEAMVNERTAAMKQAPIAIWMIDQNASIIDGNQKLAEYVGAPLARLIGFNMISDARDPSLVEPVRRALAGESVVGETFYTSTTGHRTLYCQYHFQPVMLDGKFVYVMCFAVDISERKRVEIALAEAKEQLQLAASVFTHAREGIMITDAGGSIVEVNDTFCRITGYEREELLGQNPRLLRSGRQSQEFFSSMWQSLLQQGYWLGEIWNQRKDREVCAEVVSISAVRDAHGQTQHYVALYTDITPIKQHELQLEHIAHYDALTNLPNRVLLADRLQQAMVQSRRRDLSLAVFFLDLDGFKAVNDRYGHAVGDQLLIVVAQRMKAALREVDTLARLGGDEFVAVLVDLEQPQHCEPVLERLLQAASEPVSLAGEKLQVSASIGVTLFPQDGVDADQLMRHADRAMYQAKQEGKNRYHLFDVAQDVAVKTQREGVERLQLALQRREFVLYYQPKVNMRTGQVIGAEALIRWQHPERGLLPPAAFLPMIEDDPLSVAVGEWVIDSALAQISAWQQQGLCLPVSVNVGARQLQDPNFLVRLRALLAAHPDVAPHHLELEVLETSALSDVVQVSELMHACCALGVHFALDDFGTGYSSLTYLKRLPAQLLKIDQSFVLGMLHDQNDLTIVQGVVGLATAFRRGVIAEGVETIAHGTLLLPLGCELAQGYGIARPMPAGQMLAWVAAWRPDIAWTEAARLAPPGQAESAGADQAGTAAL